MPCLLPGAGSDCCAIPWVFQVDHGSTGGIIWDLADHTPLPHKDHMAMIAYGASRFALASGHAQWGEELWPLITWCLAYCDRQRTAEGVIASNTDELEGRFPAGKANLCTSSLYYDALLSSADLGRALSIAKRRYRWFGKKDTCMIPDASSKERFLERADVLETET